ncbi:hypothetical protein PMAYCL1PPCAC_06079, partial [Pristionchus mayeri]
KEEIWKDQMLFLWPLLFLFSSALAANRPLEFSRLGEAMTMMTDYSNIHEVIDSIANDLCKEYPELHPGDDEKMILMKREITYFYTLPNDEKAKIIAGYPSEYKYLSEAMKKVVKIGKEMKPLSEDEGRLKKDNADQYALFKTCYPLLLSHLEKKRDLYEKNGMTKQEIKRDLGKNSLKLIDEWHKDDPEKEIIEASRDRIRKHYEL